MTEFTSDFMTNTILPSESCAFCNYLKSKWRVKSGVPVCYDHYMEHPPEERLDEEFRAVIANDLALIQSGIVPKWRMK